MQQTYFLILLLLGLQIQAPKVKADDFETWFLDQTNHSQRLLLANISPSDTIPGTVVASPSKIDPNYYYHWVRDAALVMMTVKKMYDYSNQPLAKNHYRHLLMDFAYLSKMHQSQESAPGGLGEVKFLPDGSAFVGPWGRPQNDGPALRAMALIQLAENLLLSGHEQFVYQVLYDSKLPTKSIIKKDLEYVSHQWGMPDFDLWEEIKGHHFFTRLVQRRALFMGAKLARRLGDIGAALFYEQQAYYLTFELSKHWSEDKGHFISTLNRVDGIDYKKGLDSSIILAIIATHDDVDREFNIGDERFMATIHKLNHTFSQVYKINQYSPELPPAIGRYPEDRYDGHGTSSLGNPWFISTIGLATYHYKLATYLKKAEYFKMTKLGRPYITSLLGPYLTLESLSNYPDGSLIHKNNPLFQLFIDVLINTADNYIGRARLYIPDSGEMAEQINRNTGVQQGARDLTWNYSAFIDAFIERQNALK